MIGRVAQIALMASGLGLIWWGWQELNILRGTMFFEYRYILLGVGAILILTCAQSLAGWIDRLTNADDA
ncbi:hypothetical protein V8J82_01385 [Gymnodinialimonas sp. 2305UL16-5]|uniref:hypothetical protein n=1 Tax=Gymnodinialimonas mytili TaxID=3126503 RepID=UPI0030AA56DF